MATKPKKTSAEWAQIYKDACVELDQALAAFNDPSSEEQKERVKKATAAKQKAWAAYSRTKKAEFKARQ